MPSTNSSTTISRQWELLKSIPSRSPGMTAKELQHELKLGGHEVSKRTVERDLDELSRLFPLVRNSRSIPYGWHWMENAVFAIPGIEVSEAVSLGLLEDVMKQLMPMVFSSSLERRFQCARAKLNGLSGNPYSKWSDLVRYIAPGLPFRPPLIRHDIMAVIQDSLLQGRKIQVQYQGVGAEIAKEITLCPVGLIQQSARTYLLALAEGREDAYLYALHRIRGIQMLKARALIPKGQNLTDFIDRGGAQFGGGKPIRLKARISNELAYLLSETPLAEDQRITILMGRTVLTATIPESWQLRFWILSQGDAVTVIEPKRFRESIVGSLSRAMAHYEDGELTGKTEP